jgi:hypothetical protein
MRLASWLKPELEKVSKQAKAWLASWLKPELNKVSERAKARAQQGKQVD